MRSFDSSDLHIINLDRLIHPDGIYACDPAAVVRTLETVTVDQVKALRATADRAIKRALVKNRTTVFSIYRATATLVAETMQRLLKRASGSSPPSRSRSVTSPW